MLVGMPHVLAQRAAWEGPRWTRAVRGIPTNPFVIAEEGENETQGVAKYNSDDKTRL